MSHRHVVFLTSIVAASIVACGGAADFAPKAPEPRGEREPREPEPASIEEAQARIERARASLAGLATSGPDTGGAAPATPSTTAPGSDASSPEAPPRPATRPSEPQASKTPAAGGSTSESNVLQKSEDRCASPCRALGSMRRAVAALCRMAGDEDARCTEAKKTLSESEGRVTPCSC